MKRENILSLLLAVCFVASFAENVWATGNSSGMVASGDVSVVFSSKNGAIVSLKGADGIERVEPAEELFSLSLLDGRGVETRYKSSDFIYNGLTDGVMVFVREGGPEVSVRIRTQGASVFFRPTVSRWPKGFRLNWIDLPHVHISQAGKTFWPFCDGCEVSDYSTRTNKNAWKVYAPLGWTPRYKSSGALYPGVAQMQFLSHYRNGKGLYFAACDERDTQKAVEWERAGPQAARLSLQTFCGEASDGVYESAFEYELRPYDGEWREACDYHRGWLRRLERFKYKPEYPAWMNESPITMIYAIKGEGIDHGPERLGANQYYPYTNVLSVVDCYSRRLNSKIMALLMHWEGTAPWCPPYVWPPYGGEAELAKLRDALHERGNLLGVYCSGTAWTQVSCIDAAYSQSAKFADENLGRFMMRGPKGEIDAAIGNHPRAQRFGYDLCLTEKWSRQTLIDEVLKMARFGIDYCQFFDQNLGGGGRLCWSAKHAHPSVPGAWQTKAMISLQEDMLSAISKAGFRMILGCECAAAAPFVGNLFFNDARLGFPRYYGKSVPGVAYVFHEWTCNFSGNQVAQRSDACYRWTRSFHAGEMMSIVLGPDGKLVNAWALPWSEPLPDQDKLLALIRSFNDLRKRYPQFLLHGKMVLPFVKVESRQVEVPGESPVLLESEVMSSFWEDKNANRIGFLTNWSERKATVRIERGGTVETVDILPRETKTIR